MADLQSIIRIIFSGENNISGMAGAIGDDISKLGDVATSIAQPFASLADRILVADAAISALAVVIGTKAVQSAAQFSTSMADLNRFLGDGEGAAEDYRDKFEQLSIQYGTGINEIVQSTSDWRAANFDIQTSLALTNKALDYSIAGQITAGEATDTLKKIIAGMAIEQDKAVESATRMGDVINYVADSSKTNFKEIATGVSILAPSFNTSGASAEQFTAIISVLAESLQSGSEAGTSLAVITGQLKAPAKDAAIALGEFGLQVDKNNITQASFYEILKTIGEQWPKLTAEEKANYAQRLVSAEQANKFATIMDNWGVVTQRSADAVSKATGSITAEVVRALKTTEASFKSFSQSIDILFITLGTQITPGVVDVVNSLKILATTLKDVGNLPNSPFKPLSDALNNALGDVAKFTDSIAKNLPEALAGVDFSGLIKSFEGVFGELGNLSKAFIGDIDLTTVDGLGKGLQKLVDTGSLLVTTTQGIIKAFNPFFDAIGRATDEFTKLGSASQLDFGEFIGSARLFVASGAAIGTILIAIGQASIDMAGIVSTAFRSVSLGINAFQITLDAVILKYYELKKASLEQKIAEENGPWGSTEKIKEYTKKLDEVNSSIEKTTASLDKNGSEFDKASDAIFGASNELNKSKESFEKTAESAKQLTVIYPKITGELQDWSTGLTQAAASSEAHRKSIIASNSEMLDWSSAIQTAKARTIEWGASITGLPPIKPPEGVSKIVDAFTAGGKSADGYAASLSGVSTAYTQVGTGTVKATGAFAKVSNKTKDAKDQLDALTNSGKLSVDQLLELTKNANDFKTKMEEIASNERVKNIEFAVDFKISQMETDAERVKATFASIDNSITSTGDLIGSLFGDLVGADDRWKELSIEEQISNEERRREALFKLQEKTAEAELRRIEAQTNSLNRGDALIQIDGTGLEPELNAFMFKVLAGIRAQVNAEFANYLQLIGS